MLRPDTERLTRRPRIEKPNETFLLENPPAAVPALPALPVPDGTPGITGPAAKPSLSAALLQETGHLQFLLERITAAARPITVAVPPEHRATLGESVTTEQYLAAAGGRDPVSHSRRTLFEKNLLSGCGGNGHWPVLLAPGILDLQSALMEAAGSLETALPLPSTRVPGPNAPVTAFEQVWPAWAEASALTDLHEELLAQSQGYRMKVGQTIATQNAHMGRAMLTRLVGPALQGELTRMGPKLRATVSLLKQLKAVFCHAQLLLSFEHVQIRQVFTQLFVEAVERQLLNGLTVMLSRLRTTLIQPVLFFLDPPGATPPVQDALSRQVVGVVGTTLASMNQQYIDLAADLLRAQRKKSELRLHQLQVLGERQTVGRWMEQLDQVVAELERFLAAPRPTEPLRALLKKRVLTPPIAAPDPLLADFEREPTLIADPTPFVVRAVPFTGGDPGLTATPPLGGDPEADDAVDFGDENLDDEWEDDLPDNAPLLVERTGDDVV